MAENKVSVELTVEEKAAEKALENFVKKVMKVESASEAMGKSGDNAFKKMKKSGDDASDMFDGLADGASAGFGQIAKGVTVANLMTSAIIGSAQAMKQFVVDSVNAAIQQENALNKLGAALKRTGEYTKGAMQDFESFASGIQANSTFGDEVILEQLAIAKSYGLTNDRAKQLVQAATELSATFGMSLDSSVKNLGKSLSGMTGELGEALPMIKNLTAEQLKAGGAIELVNTKFAGSAKAELDTYQGAVKSMTNAYGDLQEQMGFYVTQSNFVKESVKSLSMMFQQLTVDMQKANVLNKAETDGYVDTATELEVLAGRYAQATSQLEKYQSIAASVGVDRATLVDSKIKIGELQAEIERLYHTINISSAAVNREEAKPVEGGNNGAIKADQKTLDARKQYYASLQQIQIDHAAWEAEQDLLNREITSENHQAELDQAIGIETEKINAKYLAEEEKNKIIEDSVARQLATQATEAKKSLEIAQSTVNAKKKIDQQQLQLEQQKQAAILGVMGSAANLAAIIAKDGSREQFLIQKAAALAQAIVATNTAAALALAVPPAPNVGLAAYAKAAGAINIAAIVASTIKGYSTGGYVDSGSTVGDKNMIRVNGGETVFTSRQTSRLLTEVANGNASTGNPDKLDELIDAIQNQPVVLILDGKEIARSVRNQIDSGFRLI